VPRSTRRRYFGVLRVPMLAGWLFADLFLVLFIVAFSSQPSVPTPKPTPTKTPIPTKTPTPTASPTPVVTHSASPKPTLSPKPKPTPSPKPTQIGVEQNPQNLIVDVSPVDVDNPATSAAALAALLEGLNAQLASHHLLGDTAGFVVIFATSVTGNSDPVDEAIKVANSVLPVLKKQDAVMFGRTSGEGFWGGNSGDYFHFQIFFFTK
jgi:hypothetical protein